MAPILIDSRGVIKLGFISALTTVLVFVGGFLTGHQRASAFYQAGSMIESLPLPMKAVTSPDDIEPQVPDMMAVGEVIDVDHPETPKSTTEEVKTNSMASKKSLTAENNGIVVIADTGDDRVASSKNIVQQDIKQTANIDVKVPIVSDNEHAVIKSKEDLVKEDSNSVVVIEKTQQVLKPTLSSIELNKIKYSIQVGMYSSLVNAENMMEILQAKRLDAYVSDYINKKDEVRYNVRFGYYLDKKTAKSNLIKYKDDLSGDGYLVRFSANNIVNVADADNNIPTVSDGKVENNQAPEATTLLIENDKLSQADISPPVNTVAN